MGPGQVPYQLKKQTFEEKIRPSNNILACSLVMCTLQLHCIMSVVMPYLHIGKPSEVVVTVQALVVLFTNKNRQWHTHTPAHAN